MSSEAEETPTKPLKLVNCISCGANAFIPGELLPLQTTSCSKCGAELMMPMMLEHFELNSRIAAGGMGTVYRATDTVLQRDVAIKLMQPELADDEEGLEAFYAEARAVAQLSHTNIIQLYQFGQLNDQLYLVMELALAGSLDRLIDQNRTVSELQVLDVGIKIFKGLNVSRDLPIPVVVRFDYSGKVPGARERAVADCHRVNQAIAARYTELVDAGLLHTMLTVRDRDNPSPAETVGSSLDPVRQEAH